MNFRRLCPELSFFQQATEYPLGLIANGQVERLHKRVEQSALNYANVERRGLGVKKVCPYTK